MPGEELAELSAALEAAVARAGASTVLIDARRRYGASGIVWGPGILITAAHVIEHSERIAVRFADGRSQRAELAGMDAGADVAVLRVEADSLTVPSFAAPPDVGALALTLGRPSADGISASLGIVSAVGGPWRTRLGVPVSGYLRTDARMLPGFSGGPLVSARGEVFGMNTSLLARDGGFTIPHAALQPLVESLLAHGRVRRAFLGVATQPIAIAQAGAPAGIAQEHGLLVTSVDTGGPAARAGLLLGDVLLALGDTELEDTDELLGSLGAERIEVELPLRVLRAGTLRDLRITPGERD